MGKIIMEEEVELTDREQEIYDAGHQDGIYKACTYIAFILIAGCLFGLIITAIIRH